MIVASFLNGLSRTLVRDIAAEKLSECSFFFFKDFVEVNVHCYQ